MAFGWLTVAEVRTYAGLRPGDAVDDAALSMAAAAAEDYVEDVKPQYLVPGDPEAVPPTEDTYGPVPATILLGAAMLAWRWYSRRSSPLGVIGYAEMGTAGILRHDPDIGRLLKIGTAGAFVFGAPTTTTTEV